MKPFKISCLQQLYECDKSARMVICEELTNFISQSEDFLRTIFFSDEAVFHLNGRVHRHNCVIWCKENPHAMQEVPLKSPRLVVWGEMFKNSIIGPFFFDGNVNSASYQAMLETYLFLS